MLYELFALPTLRGARCVLLGACNTLNLTQWLLPRLRARNCEPELAQFPAYTVEQLKQLLKARLSQLPGPVFEEPAVHLCACKVASATGDMRRMLWAACGAVDVAVSEALGATDPDNLQEVAARACIPSSGAPGLVRVAHMARALAHSFRVPVVDTIRALPLNPQLVVCCAVLLLRGTDRKDTTVGALNDAYLALCKRNALLPISAVDFTSVCTMLVESSIFSADLTRADRDRKRRLSVVVGEEDLVFALQSTHLFARLLA